MVIIELSHWQYSVFLLFPQVKISVVNDEVIPPNQPTFTVLFDITIPSLINAKQWQKKALTNNYYTGFMSKSASILKQGGNIFP